MTGYYDSPIGFLQIDTQEGCIVGVKIVPQVKEGEKDPLAEECAKQIREYLEGERTHFDLPIRLTGTAFQRQVWEELGRIAYGQIASYGDIAAALGKKGAARAVGAACGKNPVWILVPCHRVVGKNGTLTGYAGGVEIKERLLQLERERPQG